MLEESYRRFESLLLEIQSRWDQIVTEEDSKLQLIQRILTDVLGWQIKDFQAERQHDSGFSDYIISDANVPAFVVEAKRLGKLSINTTEHERYKAFKISGPALKDCISAIEQARGYASDEGIGFFVVTDGSAWIIGKTNIEGRRWKEAEAFVFPSSQAVQENFSPFYDLLHLDQVRRRVYIRAFDEVHHGRVGFDREQFAAFSQSDISLEKKSSLAFDLDRVFDVYFSRMRGEDDQDLLINCFVESRESRIADFSLEKMTAKILGNINPDFYNLDSHLASLVTSAVEVEDGQTVFIIGPTGAGKTTFIDRFFRKTLPQKIREQCAVASINMRDSIGDELNAVPWLVERLITEFEKEMFEDGYPKWDNLLGLYFGDYKRRSEGEFKELYDTDPSQFKIRFGEIVAEKVRIDREGYLRRLVSDLVNNRKKLPVLIIDNIDELSFELQKSVFQASQALRRHAQHFLVLVPITDKSAWTFSKSDIFGIYASKSFFLPTPSPREVFRKRIDYLRQKAERTEADGTASKYFLSRGIRVNISDLQAFSKVLEEVFVDNEYASKTIGELSNYNTRRMLSLSRRVMTSAVFGVDELIKGVISGGGLSPTPNRFMNALMRGDYSFFKEGDTNEIFPLFKTSGKFIFSPLLPVRILSLLQSVSMSGKSIEDKHLSHESIFSFFDYFGVSESSISLVLTNLLEAKLIETYDTSASSGDLGTMYSISFAGSCHLRLALSNWVFIEQMACTTLIDDRDVALQIRSEYNSDGPFSDRLKKVRSTFASYLLAADRALFQEIPDSPQYASQTSVSENVSRLVIHSGFETPETPDEQLELSGKVDWFDRERGFGFIKMPDKPDGVYVKDTVLYASGFNGVSQGDTVRFSAVKTTKGLSVAKILQIDTGRDLLTRANLEVVRIFWDRKYGFARIVGTENDAFFHFSAFPAELMNSLSEGVCILADVHHDEKEGDYQVRSVAQVLGRNDAGKS